MRSEQDIFDDLAALCVSRGYVHALASICFRDTIVGFSDDVTSEDLSEMRSRSKLIRTEITTLIGLMMRGPINFSLPEPQVVSDYIEQSEILLEQLHQTLLPPIPEVQQTGSDSFVHSDDFTFSTFLREAIFYGAESAYPYQYRDLSPRKYRADSDWLLKNKSVNLEVGAAVCRGLADVLERRLLDTLTELKHKPLHKWTVLPGFVFSCEELAKCIDQPIEYVRAFVEAFTLPEIESNSSFTSLGAYNAAVSYPFIRTDDDEFVLLQYYGVSEAFYETPFYWMCSDEEYSPIAFRHRGEFTEDFSVERLAHVFGPDRVIQNVTMFGNKGGILGEIDVLVTFGDRAIILQAKSKKLTFEARRGNERVLQDDFRKAVQDAVDQSFACAELLGDPTVTLRSKDGGAVFVSVRPRTIFPLTVVVDHYPALALQARHLLRVKATDQIVSPLVTDVFALDAITEMLSSPLRFLSYLHFRSRFGDQLMASHEHMLLSYHLKQNLWLANDVDIMWVQDDVSSDLDVAMAVRREGVPGAATPAGILTRFEGTHYARIISEIEDKEEPAAIDLGLMLLELGEDTILKINEYISKIVRRTKGDGDLHNMVIGISDASTGLTVHCSRVFGQEELATLHQHCLKRKYSEKAKSWFGIALSPDGVIRIVVELVGEWKFDPSMEIVIREGS